MLLMQWYANVRAADERWCSLSFRLRVLCVGDPVRWKPQWERAGHAEGPAEQLQGRPRQVGSQQKCTGTCASRQNHLKSGASALRVGGEMTPEWGDQAPVSSLYSVIIYMLLLLLFPVFQGALGCTVNGMFPPTEPFKNETAALQVWPALHGW